MAAIYNVLLLIDGAINDLTNSLYKLFLFFAKLNLFSDETYQDVVGRIYIILGMIMLFVLAYALLRAVINPDDFSKGDTSFPNLIKNIVISIAIIAVLPSVFTLAFNIQNSILNQGTIPRLILGNNGDMGESSGVELTYYTYQVFFHVNEETCIEDSGRDSNGKMNISGNELTAALAACGNGINTNNSNVKWYTPWRLLNKEQTFSSIDGSIKNGEISFTNYNQFGEAVAEKRISYYPVISLAASVFILWVLANFCFDMALRVIKLMFYQIIAPIPVVCRAIPIGGLKDVFNKWTKNTIHTFLEVFIRIAVMYIGIDMVRLVVSNNSNIQFDSLNGILPLIARGLIIMGIVMFIRQAPKLIGDLFGIDSGNMKLGLVDKLAQGGVLTAGAAVAGGAGMLARNLVNGAPNIKKRFEEARKSGKGNLASAWAAGGAVAKTAGSMFAGSVSGFTRAGYGARSAKNFEDLKKASSSAIKKATDNRDARTKYRASHESAKSGLLGELETTMNVVRGHTADTIRNAGDWLGINSLDAFNAEKAFYDSIIKIDDNSDQVAADLLTRDQIKGSQKYMQQVGISYGRKAYTMSLDAIKTKITALETAPNAYSEHIKSGGTGPITLKNFTGDDIVINSADDYTQYVSQMRIQAGKAERDARKFMKRYGYAGDGGRVALESLVGKLGDGEVQRFNKLTSDQKNVADLVATSQNYIAALNAADSTDPSKRVTKVDTYVEMDNLTNNAKNRKIAINAEIEKLTREREARNGGKEKK